MNPSGRGLERINFMKMYKFELILIRNQDDICICQPLYIYL